MPARGDGSPRTRSEAQRRADRIRACQDELEQATRDGALTLTSEQGAQLKAYHHDVLSSLARDFDVDVSSRQKQVSRGMQVAGLLGGLALGASVFLFVLRIWGLLSTTAQVAVLLTGSFGSLLLLELVSRRERLRFLTPLAALVAFAGFSLNLEGLAKVFALEPRPTGLLAYAVFALALAYAHRHRLLLVVGASCAAASVAALLVHLTGVWWMDAVMRPEGFIVGGALVVVAGLVPHRTLDEFPPYLRGVGLLLVLVAILALSRFGEGSWIAAAPEAIEATYQVMLFIASAAAIGIGMTRGWHEVALVGVLFFLIALCMKFVDWWWDWMPKYLFFLIVGLTALALLWAFRRLRARLAAS